MITYSAVILDQNKKSGKVHLDKHGYGTFLIGALGKPNSSGLTYLYEESRAEFEEKSTIQRKIAGGTLYGEEGHPVQLEKHSITDFITRLLRIDRKKTSTHFRKLTLDDQLYRNSGNDLNKGEVGIVAELAPAGPYGDSLRKSILNPHENTSWSMRTITDPVYSGNVLKSKIVTRAITFDSVTTGGVSSASKGNSPGCEEHLEVTPEDIEKLVQMTQDPTSGLEAGDLEDLKSLITMIKYKDQHSDAPLLFEGMDRSYLCEWR